MFRMNQRSFLKFNLRRLYNTTASSDAADGRRIVEFLRRQYEQKKLQHINAAEKDKATILSHCHHESQASQAPPEEVLLEDHRHFYHHQHRHASLEEYENSTRDIEAEGIYGLGYTSPKEVYVFFYVWLSEEWQNNV